LFVSTAKYENIFQKSVEFGETDFKNFEATLVGSTFILTTKGIKQV